MSEPPPESKPRKCSLCGKPQDPKYRPFCSRRCADIDLGRWLNGDYRIPGNPDPDTFGEDN
jgi:endogenous inhibitor of DNA gyrase (YacG/DUF329 family)